jgi:hypothetical protein
VAGTVRYFADRFGVPRAAIEGTNLPLDLIRRYAVQGPPSVEVHDGRRAGLTVVRRTQYAGFELGRQRQALAGAFPGELASAARDALVQALLDGRTPHPDQGPVRQAFARLVDYWKKSGGALTGAEPATLRRSVRRQLEPVGSWEAFLATPVALEVGSVVPDDVRRALDALPSALPLLGDKVPLVYDFDDGTPVVRVRMKEGQARRLRPKDLPRLDRPLVFSVMRGRQEVLRTRSVEELRAGLAGLPRRDRGHRRRRR